MTELHLPLPEPEPPPETLPGQAPRIASPPKPPAPEPPAAPPVEPPPGIGPVALSPAEPEALPGIDWLALLLFIIGFILAAVAFTDFLNWLLRKLASLIPGNRKAPQLDTTSVTQKLSNSLGQAQAKLDNTMGVSFTKLGTLYIRAARAMVQQAQVSQIMARHIARLEGHATLQDHNARVTAHQGALTRTALQHTETRLASVAAETATRERAQEAQIIALTEHLTRVIEPELARLRSRIPPLEKRSTTAWDLLQQHDELLGIGAMTATVGVAMRYLGAEWTQCENNQNVGKAICATNPNTLEKLLKGSLDLLGIIEVCSIVRILAAAGRNDLITGALGVFSSGIEDLLKCTGATLAPPLNTPQARLAPSSPWAALAPVTL